MGPRDFGSEHLTQDGEPPGDEPIRTCVSCRARKPRARLIRVARRGDGSIHVGPGPGRGSYVCFDEMCVERAVKGALRKGLRCEGALPDGLLEELEQLLEKQRLEKQRLVKRDDSRGPGTAP